MYVKYWWYNFFKCIGICHKMFWCDSYRSWKWEEENRSRRSRLDVRTEDRRWAVFSQIVDSCGDLSLDQNNTKTDIVRLLEMWIIAVQIIADALYDRLHQLFLEAKTER